ncbi:hypothetical protein H6501_05260 [Candidatus Woesearchaeota archaeon]|nr:hypothetical protein [Candidatus Woesearchaeota archaeon]USN44083.1 MAG: hypothetical protein H6500_06875 [Candidatus Woesearchaeota archaeon]
MFESSLRGVYNFDDYCYAHEFTTVTGIPPNLSSISDRVKIPLVQIKDFRKGEGELNVCCPAAERRFLRITEQDPNYILLYSENTLLGFLKLTGEQTFLAVTTTNDTDSSGLQLISGGLYTPDTSSLTNFLTLFSNANVPGKGKTTPIAIALESKLVTMNPARFMQMTDPEIEKLRDYLCPISTLNSSHIRTFSY